MIDHGSVEGRLEAQTFIRENDEKVRRGLKAMQESWLKAHKKTKIVKKIKKTKKLTT